MFRMFKSFNSDEKAQMVDAGVKGMLLVDAFLTVGALIYIVNNPSFLSGNNNPEATSHSFFYNPGCGEFLKRKILFAARYLAREPEHPQLDMMNRQRK